MDYPNDDTPDAEGYGPVNVYDKLDKSLARTNADSYAYYASVSTWRDDMKNIELICAACSMEYFVPASSWIPST